jgi:hypothetical protein
LIVEKNRDEDAIVTPTPPSKTKYPPAINAFPGADNVLSDSLIIRECWYVMTFILQVSLLCFRLHSFNIAIFVSGPLQLRNQNR